MESFVSKLRSRKGRNLKEKPKKRLDKNESMEDQGQGPYVHDKEGNENKGLETKTDSILLRLRKRKPTQPPILSRTNVKRKASQPNTTSKSSSKKRKAVGPGTTKDKKIKLAAKKSVKSSTAHISAVRKSTSKKNPVGSFKLQGESMTNPISNIKPEPEATRNMEDRPAPVVRFDQMMEELKTARARRASLPPKAECEEPSTPENRGPSTPEMSPTLVNSIKTKSGQKPIKTYKRRFLRFFDDDQDPLVVPSGLQKKISFLDLDFNVKDEVLEVSNAGLGVVSPEVDVEVDSPGQETKSSKRSVSLDALPLIPLSKKKVVESISDEIDQKSSGSRDRLAEMFSDPESE